MPHSYINHCRMEGTLRLPLRFVEQSRGEGVAFKLEVTEKSRIGQSEWTYRTDVFEIEAGPAHARYMRHLSDGDILIIDGQVRRRRTRCEGTEVIEDYIYGTRIRTISIRQNTGSSTA